MVEPINSSSLLAKVVELASLEDRSAALDKARLYRGSRLTKGFIPMIITTDYQVSRIDGQHMLFWSGPKNTQWNFNQRGTIQQSRSGHIAHFWRDDKRSTFFDNPSINFTFQTGNLLPLRIAEENVQALPPGLVDYYDFFQFMDEKKILSSGRPNYINIVYHSLLYPTILLRGFFEPETTITVAEDASRPASVEWNATFRIKETDPPFYESTKLINTWRAATSPDQSLLLQDLRDETSAFAAELENFSPATTTVSQEALTAELNRNIEEQFAEKQQSNRFIDFITEE